MSTIEDTSIMLEDFGLTSYEAKVYLAAIKLGMASASQIGKASGIRREEVYRTLPKLEKIGLLDRVLGRPIQFKAISVNDGLSMLIQKKEVSAKKEIRNLSIKKDEILKKFKPERIEPERIDENSHFILVSEKDTVAKRMESLIQESQNSIDIVDAPINVVRFMLNYEESLSRAIRRNVQVRIITEYPDDQEALLRMLESNIPNRRVVLKYIDDIPSRYVLIDKTEVMLGTSIKGGATNGKSLWTQDTNLVAIIRRDFEECLSRSIAWQSYITTPAENLIRSLRHLRPRDHVVLFYDSQELKRQVLFSYIKNGLERGDGAVYVCSEETVNEIIDGMKRYGIDVESHLRSKGLVVVDYADFYIKKGQFSIDDVMEGWESYYNEAQKNGFKGLRVTGEMSCFIKHNLTEELLDYEKALHTVLDIPIMAICAYSSEALQDVDNPVNVYSELIKAHGKVLYAEHDRPAGRVEVRV
ncbi:MAG: MEDS domain-containing protein [Candidatus Thorarchaeota archaeon]